jgi:hypothetical protein
VKLSELREAYYKSTEKASELVRNLGFTGIAVVWILKTGDHAGGIKFSDELLLPLALSVGGLSCDLLQYLYKSAVWGSLNWHYWRKHHNNDADVTIAGGWNWLALILFWLKAALVIVAFGYLLTFLYLQLRFPTSTAVH